MRVTEQLKPEEIKRLTEIDEQYGHTGRFLTKSGIRSRGTMKALIANGYGLLSTVTKVRNALSELDEQRERTPDEIVALVAAEYKITVEELKNPASNKVKVEARQVAALMLEKETKLSRAAIAKILNYKDHTGVAIALKAIGDRYDTERIVRHRIIDLRAKIQTPQ